MRRFFLKTPALIILPFPAIGASGVQKHDPENTWEKINKKRLAGIEEFKDRWDLISIHLRSASKAEPSDQRQLFITIS
ncbi:hypothetical protein D4S03_09095 [bacterium]|nr:MAG: hypothetical protein D4S03_09095 [bacterium]